MPANRYRRVLSKFPDAFPVQGRGARPQLPAGIVPEVVGADVGRTDFRERHRPPVAGRLRLGIDLVDEVLSPRAAGVTSQSCILSPVFASNVCIDSAEVSKLIRFPTQSNGGRSSFTVNSVPSSVIR